MTPAGIRLITQGPDGSRILATAETMEEARELAVCFLTDPRDTVETVHFYDVRRERFRGWLRRQNLPASQQILTLPLAPPRKCA